MAERGRVWNESEISALLAVCGDATSSSEKCPLFLLCCDKPKKVYSPQWTQCYWTVVPVDMLCPFYAATVEQEQRKNKTTKLRMPF